VNLKAADGTTDFADNTDKEGISGEWVLSTFNLKKAVQPQMNPDEHRLAAYGRAIPPHPQGERLRRGLHQCLSVSICGFSVSTAEFRFNFLL